MYSHEKEEWSWGYVLYTCKFLRSSVIYTIISSPSHNPSESRFSLSTSQLNEQTPLL